MTKKLKYMPYAQAKVIKTDKLLTLVSYSTPVIYITKDNWLTITGTYSQTTRRHISAFLKEYVPCISYQQVKRLYENQLKLNLFTGEVVAV